MKILFYEQLKNLNLEDLKALKQSLEIQKNEFEKFRKRPKKIHFLGILISSKEITVKDIEKKLPEKVTQFLRTLDSQLNPLIVQHAELQGVEPELIYDEIMNKWDIKVNPDFRVEAVSYYFPETEIINKEELIKKIVLLADIVVSAYDNYNPHYISNLHFLERGISEVSENACRNLKSITEVKAECTHHQQRLKKVILERNKKIILSESNRNTEEEVYTFEAIVAGTINNDSKISRLTSDNSKKAIKKYHEFTQVHSELSNPSATYEQRANVARQHLNRPETQQILGEERNSKGQLFLKKALNVLTFGLFSKTNCFSSFFRPKSAAAFDRMSSSLGIEPKNSQKADNVSSAGELESVVSCK